MTLDPNVLYATSSAVNAVTSFALGLFILIKNPKSKLNQLWWWMSLAIALWAGLLSVMFQCSAAQENLALISNRLSSTSAIFIPLLYLHFTVVFLQRTDQSVILKYCYVLSILLACFGLTRLFVHDVTGVLGFRYYPHAGPLYWYLLALYLLESTYAIFLMWQERKKATGVRRAHITYVMAAGVAGFLLGATMFPICFDIPIPPIGGHGVWLYCLFVAWAVFKHHLFNIQVVIRRSILYSLLIALLITGYFGLVYAAQQFFRMTLLQHHILALCLTSITTFGLGLLVFLAGPRKHLNQIFGFYSLAITWWGITEAFLVGAPNELSANLWSKIEWPGVIFIAPTFIHTVFLLTGQKTKKTQITLRIAYLFSFIFVVSHLFTNLVTAPPKQVGYVSFHNSLTMIGSLIPLTFLIIINIGLWKLFSSYKSETGQRRTQLKYLFWGSLIGYLGGSPDWLLVFSLYIPILNPFGIYSVPLYSLATTYAVLQHRLFDVNVVIRKSLVYSLLITVLTVGYFGLVLAIERLFQQTFGYQSIWMSLTAFALMALLFQPLKFGVQRFVDWLFFRAPHEELVKRMERLELETQQTEKFKAVATLAAGLSHELKNPLQAIQTYAEFLPENYQDPAFRERCREVIQSETGRLNNLLKQLMDFAKPKQTTFSLIEPHDIIDSTLNLLSNECLKHRVQMEKDYKADGARILGDSDQIRQVILNLTLNAIQAIGQHGRIAVRTRQDNGWFIIEVEDTGPGIAANILPKIFEPFQSNKPEGTGLGLSITQHIIKEHRGNIWVQTRMGLGTTFTIRLPIEKIIEKKG